VNLSTKTTYLAMFEFRVPYSRRYLFKLGQDKFSKAFTPQKRLDKTVQSPIYSGLPKTVGDCRELISHRRRGQDITVLSCPRLRCELGINVQQCNVACSSEAVQSDGFNLSLTPYRHPTTLLE